jgi:hypothetical protein
MQQAPRVIYRNSSNPKPDAPQDRNLCALHPLRGRPDGLNDVLITSAPAEVRGQDINQILIADMRIFFQHTCRQHQKSWRAKPALQAMMFGERALERMQFTVPFKPFDRANKLSIRLNGEHQAGAHRRVIDKNGAGPTHAVLTSNMCTGFSTLIANCINQRQPRLNTKRMALTVYNQRDINFLGQAAARSKARRVTTATRSHR